MHSTNAFKAYDIRGRYNQDIDEQLTYSLGRGIASYLYEHYGEKASLFIGADTRGENNTLIQAFLQGLYDNDHHRICWANFGSEVPHPNSSHSLQRGICSSEYVYGIAHNTFDLAVTFTASHNPAGDVGLKFVDKDVVFLPTSLLQKLYEHHNDKPYKKNSDAHFRQDDVLYQQMVESKQNYDSFLQSKRDDLSASSFAVDFAHGAGVSCEQSFLRDQMDKHTIHFLNNYPDGTFPVHDSETQDATNYRQLMTLIQEKNLDFGVLFDGDVDRLGIVTNQGTIIPGDILTAILAKEVLAEAKRGDNKEVLYDVMSSRSIVDAVEDEGGKASINRMGRFFMNRTLRERKAIFGGECSGHFLFGQYGGYEIPLLALSYFVRAMHRVGDAETLYRHSIKYPKTPVINKKVPDKDAVLARVSDHFSSFDVRTIDGVNVFGDDFFLTIRKSNTSDKVRYCVEADTSEVMEERLGELEELIE